MGIECCKYVKEAGTNDMETNLDKGIDVATKTTAPWPTNYVSEHPKAEQDS